MQVRGRKGKAAQANTAESGGSSSAPQSGATTLRKRVSAQAGTARAAGSVFGRKGGGKASKKKGWSMPQLSVRDVMLLRHKEGREQVAEYWGKVMEDLMNVLSGAKAEAGEVCVCL